jgi:hypothetical protein
MAVLLAGELGAVPDEEAGVAREFVILFRDDVDDEFFGDEFAAGDTDAVHVVGLVQVADDAAGVRGVG